MMQNKKQNKSQGFADHFMKKSKTPSVQIYTFEGLNRDGKKLSGDIQATSLMQAKIALHKQGLVIRKIKNKSGSLFSRLKKKIRPKDIMLFSRQFSTMLHAGIPILQAFDIVAKSQTNLSMISLLHDLKAQVETGSTLAEALKKHPLHFSPLYCNLVHAGEFSGSLELILTNLANYLEKIENIKNKIKKALLYPTIIIVVGILVSAVLLIFVIPQFKALFSQFGADLPIFTLIVVAISQWVEIYWYILLGVLILFITLFIYAYRHIQRFRTIVDKYSLKMPILGNILRKAAIARFSRTLSITFAAGLPLFDALKLVQGATGNAVYATGTQHIAEEIATGQTVQAAMSNTNLFPNMVIQMVAIGEESGTLEDMLSKVADFYEKEVDDIVDNLSTLIEPLIICIIGVLVGGLVIAMYLPIFKLGSIF